MKNYLTNSFGWGYNRQKTRAMKRKKSQLDLFISVIIAFLVIFIISQVLTQIDQQIRSPYSALLSRLNPLSVSNVYAGNEEAIKMIQSHREINIVKGQAFTFTVGFKNLSNQTWQQKGSGKVELKLPSLSNGQTQFRHKFWRTSDTPAWLSASESQPGRIAFYKFALQSPDQAGVYKENFVLVRDGQQVLPGSEFEITLNVWDSVAQFPQNQANNTTKTTQKIVSQDSNIVVYDRPSENKYKTDLEKRKLAEKCMALAGKRFRLASTASNSSGSLVVDQQVLDDCLLVNIDLSDNVWIDPDEPVATNANTTTTNTSTTSSSGNIITANSLALVPSTSDGPTVRIGLFATTEPIVLTANTSYQITDQNNNILETVNSNAQTQIVFNFSGHNYTYLVNGKNITTDSFLRFIGQVNTVFEVVSFESRPAWNTSLNDNKFLGILETRYSFNTGKFWLINELPMEIYLKGLAETSEASPLEYQKALITAARTYAMHHYNRGTKHANEYFTLDARYDQVYKGYGSQIRLPKVSRAVEETKGMVVTYNGEIAITPYFSHSDGKTRDWSEVWGGDVPWCKSVVEPEGYDRDYMYGHGVGMSARGAIFLANDGYSFENILKYYYTGVQIGSAY